MGGMNCGLLGIGKNVAQRDLDCRYNVSGMGTLWEFRSFRPVNPQGRLSVLGRFRRRQVRQCMLACCDFLLAQRCTVSLAAMKEQDQSKGKTVSIRFSGELVVDRADFEELLRTAAATPATPVVSPPAALASGTPEGLPRLAYTTRETAEILGVSYLTVYRLMQRGLLRGSSAVRTKLIPRREIERFLEKTVSHP